MTSFSEVKIKSKILIVMTLVVMITSITFSVIYLKSQKEALLTSIDSKLMAVARSAEYILPENYHDSIIDGNTVSKEDYLKIIDRYNRLCLKLGLEYVWSLMVIDDRIVFTSSTSTDKKVESGKHALFFDVHSNPEAYKKAFETMEIDYRINDNEWGYTRVVLVPSFDSKGRRYLFGASMKISDVDFMLKRTVMNSLMISVAVFLLGGFFSFLLAKSLSIPIVKLTKVAESIAGGNLYQNIDVRGSFELKSLSGSLNYMSKAIIDKISELNSKNDELEIEINERKQAEAALQEAYSIINRSPAVAFLWKNAERWPVEFVSDNINELFGYKAEEFTSGKISYAEVVHPDDLARVIEEVKTFSGEEGKKEFTHNPYRIVTKDGETKWLDDMTLIRRDEKGDITHYEGIVLDISERIKAEEEKENLQDKLQRSHKMESMGLLASGVAHDLNNVLSGIVSYPELLLLDLPEDSKLRKPIETMQQSGHRAAAIVQDLLTVARGVATTKEPLNLNDIVRDYLQSPEFKKLEQFHPTVTVKTNLDTDLFNISGSHVHIRKVVMNLVSNASEAIESSGNTTISTMNRYLDRPLRGYDDIKMGGYAVLSVSDDGSGISSDDLERIFEPFYTKKVMGRSGTGLGLAVVWNVVQDHQGYIDVTTDENGTTFELYFQITRDEISDKALSVSINDFKGNGETILVVDDDESQKDISCKMLDTLGYKTKAVSSGEEAVEYLKENSVDLILLDMIMDPDINGRETYERIIKIHPNQKAIIVSGFAETDAVKETQKLGAGKYVKKPLTLKRIGLAVKKELEK
jgi:PAS domain S-box-containing protein